MNKFLFFLMLALPLSSMAQNVMTPELLWSLGKVSVIGTTTDGKTVVYKVSHTNLKTEKSNSEFFYLNTNNKQSTKLNETDHLGGELQTMQWDANGNMYAIGNSKIIKLSQPGTFWELKDAENIRISPDGKWIAFSKQVSVEKILGKERYSDVPNSTAQVYTNLNYRHWDAWNMGTVSHVFIMPTDKSAAPQDIMEGEPYDCPQKPFGGTEDFIFSPDSKTIVYVCKKKTGKEYAQSTNTDIYAYSVITNTTMNLSEGMMGYDVAPAFNADGSKLAWLSMQRDGYEADKNDIVVMNISDNTKMNLTAGWNETVDGGFLWNKDGGSVFFNAAIKGTMQLFEVNVPTNLKVKMLPVVKQLTNGNFDVASIFLQNKDELIVSRTDFNHAAELYSVNTKNGKLEAITHANDDAYKKIQLSNSKLRMVATTDGKQMGVWVIYPPNFDPSKKYPTLLYCQGGPESALTQFYSFRWNFQLMAANGYIVVAPNRRGMPGWGAQWNEAIAGDWGGQAMRDYLTAIDDVAKEAYVDKTRLGCVGASYGGYSVFMLAGIHNNRFKTFIAHDGLFDMKSWYGTTEELWFANWDLGGSYWKKPTPKSYQEYDPSNFVNKWNKPIMIVQGGLDFRVPIEQGLEAFQAAQLHGLKSKLLYLPNENHWVLNCHNGLVWQREFFSWLKETL